ncbi:MAG: TrkA family potassium uptake protein [Candidatus Aegiribacteria sp.]|nr:TrkA family potassium uptake protein [Candidatus Aegiribacteria sp.]
MSPSDNSSKVCVVSGAGDTGLCVIKELVSHGFTATVVDKDPDALKTIEDMGITITAVQGNCLIDNILKKTDLLNARALFCVLPDDRSNVFLSLSARRINPELEIYSVASDISAERKLKLVGTRRTVNQDAAEGLRISNEMLRPDVAKFLDGIVFARDKTEGYISIEIYKKCPSIGKTLKKLELHNRTGVVIIAVKKNDGSYVYSPSGDYRLSVGDNLICFGTGDDRKAIQNLLATQQDRKEKWGSLRHVFRK